MALVKAEVLTPWIEILEGGVVAERRPLVATDYRFTRWQDITGQSSEHIMPEPNLLSILAEADETLIDQIRADDRFFVLWEEYV